MKHSFRFVISSGLVLFALTACQAPSSETPLPLASGGESSSSNSSAPIPSGDAPTSDQRSYSTDALLFVGSGTWSPEVSALKSIMNIRGMTYKTVDESQLNSMSLGEISQYGMLIFPGGKGGTQAGSLTPATHERLRQAVQDRGISYIGWCAGAFIAAAPAQANGQDVSYGLGVLNAPILDYYYLENQGVSVAMTKYSFADGRERDIIWYGGPITTNIPGSVVARYPTGDPAITQTYSGNGLVTLVAGHPTVTESAKVSLGLNDSDGSDQDIAWELLEGTLNRTPLRAF